jgi:uncharacterized membrane protein YbaN (DUF454 family)
MNAMKLSAKRHLFTALGILFVAIGVVAIFVPLIPTTPFLLLAALCFDKGSEKFRAWLLNHKTLGPPIHDWRRNKVIRTKHKTLATVMVVGPSYFLFSKPTIPLVGKAAFAAFMAVLLLYIWTRRSKPTGTT